MNNQDNNMFSNMIQPSSVPEVNNSSNNLVQPSNVNSGLNNMADNNANVATQVGIVDSNLNQVSNMVNSPVAGNEQNTNNSLSDNKTNKDVNVALNPVFPNEIVANQSVVNDASNSTNNMQQPNTSNNVSSLDFVMPGEVNASTNVTFSNLSTVTDANNSTIQETNPNNIANNNLNNVNNNILGLNNNSLGGLINYASPNSVGIASEVVTSNTPVEQSNNLQSKNNVAPPSNVNNNETSEVVSVKRYLGHFLLLCIPIVGIIILIMRAFDKKDKKISNLAKAQLLFSGIFIGIALLMFIVFVVILGESFLSMIGMLINGTEQGTNQNNNNYYNDEYNYNIDEDDINNDYNNELDSDYDIDTDYNYDDNYGY